MKFIKLTQGKEAIVDDEDYEWLNQFKWHYNKDFKSGRCKNVLMARLIMGNPVKMWVLHKNNNKLDCRKSKLIISKEAAHVVQGFRKGIKKNPRDSIYLSQRITKLCLICGLQMILIPCRYNQKYCSYKCSNIGVGISTKGERRSPTTEFKRLEKTSESRYQRNSSNYKKWRESVFERDDYTCQFCGKRGGKLNADHIKPFALFKELRFDVNNGRTLCLECHKKTPTFMANPSKLKRMLEEGDFI